MSWDETTGIYSLTDVTAVHDRVLSDRARIESISDPEQRMDARFGELIESIKRGINSGVVTLTELPADEARRSLGLIYLPAEDDIISEDDGDPA